MEAQIFEVQKKLSDMKSNLDVEKHDFCKNSGRMEKINEIMMKFVRGSESADVPLVAQDGKQEEK